MCYPQLMLLMIPLITAGCCDCGDKAGAAPAPPPAPATEPTRRSLTAMIASINAENSRHYAVVVDQSGHPVAGAAVSPVTASMNGTPIKTNANGEAYVPTTIGFQAVQWVIVAKPGFDTMQTAVTDQWPLRIALIFDRTTSPATQP
jgi:hypothetical protein